MKQQLKMQAGSMAQPMSVEEVKAVLDTTEKGGVRNSIKNCLTVFQHDPLLSGAIAYNLLTDRTDVVKPIGYDRSPSASMTDTDMKYIRLYLEENYDLTSEKKIIDAADLAAHQNSYHPVRDFLNSLTWDGTERIRYCLHHFLGAEADEYTFQALRLFLLGAIHRAFHPGCKFEVMLCLVGGQGAGKSTFFRLLAGKDEWFSDDLRKLDDENVYRKLQGHWIIEMSEMIATANANMKPIRQTDCGNAYSVARQTQWTSCPSTAPATGVSCPCRSARNRQRFTFWRMKPHPDPTCSRCGRRQ